MEIYSYQSIHGTSLLVMVKARPFLTRDVNKTRELISFGVMTSAVSQEHLDHAGVITGVVTRPWGAILHNPPFWGYFHGFCNLCVDPHFKFFIFPLLNELKCYIIYR